VHYAANTTNITQQNSQLLVVKKCAFFVKHQDILHCSEQPDKSKPELDITLR